MPKLDTAVLRVARLERGLTAKALAQRVGITQSHLCNIAAGRKGASPAVLARLARTLRTPLRDLLAEGPAEDAA